MIGSAGLAILVLVILIMRGQSGRFGIILAAAAGSALGIMVTIWAVVFDIVGMAIRVLGELGTAL